MDRDDLHWVVEWLDGSGGMRGYAFNASCDVL